MARRRQQPSRPTSLLFFSIGPTRTQAGISHVGLVSRQKKSVETGSAHTDGPESQSHVSYFRDETTYSSSARGNSLPGKTDRRVQGSPKQTDGTSSKESRDFFFLTNADLELPANDMLIKNFFEENKVEEEPSNIVEQCPTSKTASEVIKQ